MNREELWSELVALPPEARQQVIDFIAFLRARYAPLTMVDDLERPDLADEAFVGMWRNRQDLEDSRSWVRGVREQEWVKPRD
ncbi:MAG: hypothetical protein ACE5H9_11675 [Anaerolineae bacterium]